MKNPKKRRNKWQGRSREDIDSYHNFVGWAFAIGALGLMIGVFVKILKELKILD